MQTTFVSSAIGINENESESTTTSKTDRYIRFVYDQIKFGKNRKLNFEVFSKAFYGYLNMQEDGLLVPNALLTVCDFTLSSNLKRLWVIDLKSKKIVFNTLVAHGQGTGEEFAVAFSNTHESHQSSLGFYTTGETYEGNNGYSLKLNGKDGQFNSNAYDRAVVIHGAEYVSDDYAKANKRIGRSHGCPALPVDVAPKIIDKIKNGHCLFIYHTSNNYLSSSRWIKSKLKSLPQEADMMDINLPVQNNPRYVASAANNTNKSKIANTSEQDSKEEEVKDPTEEQVSAGDKQNFKVDVQTITIKKSDLPKDHILNSTSAK